MNITTALKEGLTHSLLSRMLYVYATIPALSQRTEREIRTSYQRGEIMFAYTGEESKTIGWLIRSPLYGSLYELSGAYVEEPFRGRGVFGAMLEKALDPQFQYVIVTFLPHFAEYLINQYAFRRSSLYEIIRRTRGTFILKKFHIHRLISVTKHVQEGRPTYLIKE